MVNYNSKAQVFRTTEPTQEMFLLVKSENSVKVSIADAVCGKFHSRNSSGLVVEVGWSKGLTRKLEQYKES